MRKVLTSFLSVIYTIAIGQTIDFRNDSLFVNNFLVDSRTSKSKIDSLLHSNGKTTSSGDKSRINPLTGKSVTQTTVFYDDIGVFFRKSDYDSTAVIVGIKMSSETNIDRDNQSGLTEIFKGQLLIAENDMNDKKTVSQLQHLKNCEVMFRSLSTSSREYLMEGEIVYGKGIITIVFDSDTNKVTSIIINVKH